MASPTQWTWVWVNSRSWWWTGRPGVLQFMGSQRVRHDWVTELNWIVHLLIPSEAFTWMKLSFVASQLAMRKSLQVSRNSFPCDPQPLLWREMLRSLYHPSWRELLAPGWGEERTRSLLQKVWGDSTSWNPPHHPPPAHLHSAKETMTDGWPRASLTISLTLRLEINSNLNPWRLFGLIIDRKEQQLIPPFSWGETSQEPEFVFLPTSQSYGYPS